MNRDLTICFTSDIHGNFSAVDYATGVAAPVGLATLMSSFEKDGNTLIIDGGDTIQGSPFTYWLYDQNRAEECVPARLMNLAGYDFCTLGNHDFNYGVAEIERHVGALKAKCLCANVEGIDDVGTTAVVTMENGLRVGLVGITSHFVTKWETPENLEGVAVSDAFDTARRALEKLKAENVDVTICIYHGGFENNTETGEVISETGENQGYRICRELDYDILLTGHQHQGREDLCLFGTYTCQAPDKAKSLIRMEVSVGEDGAVTARSRLVAAGEKPDPDAAAFLAPYDRENAAFLDIPVGHLDTDLEPSSHIDMAVNGSLIANFFNQVQLEASGADISATSLANEVKGFNRNVTVRDVVATYVFPNTLKTIRVNRSVLKAALERSAEYFALDGEGNLRVSDAFLVPIALHFNYDYLYGLEVTVDVRREAGDRVVSILYQGEELEEGRELTLCLNNYRASGAGGYPAYAGCELVKDQPTEISEMIIEYLGRNKNVTVDKKRWLRVIC